MACKRVFLSCLFCIFSQFSGAKVQHILGIIIGICKEYAVKTEIFCIFMQNESITRKAPTFWVDAFVFVWCHQESNRGHKDFQSFALPTELWHLFCLRVQRYVLFLNQPKEFRFFLKFFCYMPESSYLCARNKNTLHSDSSAVGSVLRSGRRGREFESPLSDNHFTLTYNILKLSLQ